MKLPKRAPSHIPLASEKCEIDCYIWHQDVHKQVRLNRIFRTLIEKICAEEGIDPKSPQPCKPCQEKANS